MKKSILAIETSGQACSCALITEKGQFVRYEPTQKAHTQLLLPMMQELLTEASVPLEAIDALAVGQGPGSFTGVRIAVSAAQGLAYGLNIPVYPVSTLKALCYQVKPEANSIVIPAIDARMHEVYAAAFETIDGHYKQVGEECLLSPAELLQQFATTQTHKIIALGSGWDAYFEEITAKTTQHIVRLENRQVNALEIALIAKAQSEKGVHGVNALEVLPVYIRDNVVSV